MKPKLDIAKIAKLLGATNRGTVKARSGYFGALETLANVQAIRQADSLVTAEENVPQAVAGQAGSTEPQEP